MNSTTLKIIDCFTPLIVYTLKFRGEAESERYTIEKLTDDYTVLIAKAREEYVENPLSFTEALFPLVAWIDEVILSSRNAHRRLWQKKLLQKKFFNISDAGDLFFEKLEALPEEESTLRLLYLYALLLGFKGKYYRGEDQAHLNDIFETQKALMGDDLLHLFPEVAFGAAYAQKPLPSRKRFVISYKGFWKLVILSLGIGLILFVISQAYLDGLLDQLDIF